jgi:uncharacterized protein YrrD
MHLKIEELYEIKLAASDGQIGHIKDFYFDDQRWAVRYLVVETGSWLTGRLVLISPHAFGQLDRDSKTLSVNLTRKQIENSPSIDSHQPVSRQYEVDYYRYYGLPAYWNGGLMWGLSGSPVAMPPSEKEVEDELHHDLNAEHQRSTKAVKGYAIHATDGDIGSVSSFLVDDESWAVVALAGNSGTWFSNKEFLIPATDIEQISYEDSKIFLKSTKAYSQHKEATVS